MKKILTQLWKLNKDHSKLDFQVLFVGSTKPHYSSLIEILKNLTVLDNEIG